MLLFEKQEGDLVALRKHEVSLEEVSTSWEGNNKENQRETYRVRIIVVNKAIWIQESLNENTDQLAGTLFLSVPGYSLPHLFPFLKWEIGFCKEKEEKITKPNWLSFPFLSAKGKRYNCESSVASQYYRLLQYIGYNCLGYSESLLLLNFTCRSLYLLTANF